MKRFASSLVQHKGLVKNITLVYLHKYNWPSADREEVKDKARIEREGQGLNWEEVCGILVLLTCVCPFERKWSSLFQQVFSK